MYIKYSPKNFLQKWNIHPNISAGQTQLWLGGMLRANSYVARAKRFTPWNMNLRACTLKNIDRRVFLFGLFVLHRFCKKKKNHQKQVIFPKSRLAGRSFRALDKDPFGSKVLERYVDSIASEIKTEKNSRIMKVLSVYLKLSSEKKVKTKLFFCTRHLQRDVIIKKRSA